MIFNNSKAGGMSSSGLSDLENVILMMLSIIMSRMRGREFPNLPDSSAADESHTATTKAGGPGTIFTHGYYTTWSQGTGQAINGRVATGLTNQRSYSV